MHPRSHHRGPRPAQLPASRFIAATFLLVAAALVAAPAAGAPRVQVFGPTEQTIGPAPGTLAARPLARSPIVPFKATSHVTSAFVAVTSLPTEDVDVVEVAIAPPTPPDPPAPFPATAVWPTEGVVHFIDEAAALPFIYASIPTASPNISGVDFISDGTWGAFATLGFLYIYDMSAPPGGLPVLTATIPLPGTPARRDIDPILIKHPGSPSGIAVVYATGTEIHCYAIPTGVLLWSIPLPSPVVEAVDPQINAPSTLLFVPTEGFMTAIDPVAGALLPGSPTFLGTTLVREVDARFVLGDALCYLPATGALFVFDGSPAPPGPAVGALLATIPLTGALIEGNDLEVEPTGTFGFIPTLPFMHQVSLSAMAIAFSHPFLGAVHQRNQDAVFTPPGATPPGDEKAVYCTQGLMWIYDIFPPGAVAPVTVAIPGTLVDGVDPMFTDTPPFGIVATVSTIGFTSVVNVMTAAHVAPSPLSTPGVLRTDTDSKPGPVPGNRVLQPTLGGLWIFDGFLPTDWVVTTSGGVYVVNTDPPGPPGPFVDQFIPTTLAYRGGDAQPTTLLGPPEPAFSVDHPDQDFLTKCWEYKFALNRWPYWWYYSYPAYYPHWIPYGVFGPPALLGWDILNHYKVTLLGPPGGLGDQVGILDERGNLIQTIPLEDPPGTPLPAIGGFIWDWDNKICKLRLYGLRELVINLGANPITWKFVNYGAKIRWFPVIDRMNGWEFSVYQGGRTVWVYDHLKHVLVTTINLPATCIRRPVFDEQRKVLCLTLANRRLFFINAHRLRLGLPNPTYLCPDLGYHVVGVPVFDLYNHHVIVKLYGSRLAVCDVDNGALVWTSGVLPYWPISPIRIDCYNKVAKGYYRDFANYYELHLNLYPLVFGGLPILNWVLLPGQPFGYPIFDSKDGYEFDVILPDRIYWRKIFNPAVFGFITTPFPIIGNLFFDRVNKFGLVRLQNGQLFWFDAFKVTHGMAGASHAITLLDAPLPAGKPIAAEDDIVFDTQGRHAVVHLANGQVAVVDMEIGDEVLVSSAFPNLRRQLYVHPFRHLVNWPWDGGGGGGGEVTIDLSPWYSHPQNFPIGTVTNTPQPPLEATDFNPPPPPPAAGIVTRPHLGGDIPIELIQLELTGLQPGVTIQATNTTKFNSLKTDEPNEGQAEEDGSLRGIAVAADPGDMVCFVAFDAAGNASPPTCVPVAAPVRVPTGEEAPLGFSMTSENPVRDEARFRFTLPQRSRVDLAIYDLAGRRLAGIVSGELEAGEHDATWRLDRAAGGRIPAGMYFARFRAGAYEASQRLVVIP